MGRRSSAALVVAVLLASVAGSVAAVTIDAHPQRVHLGENDVTAGKEFSVDSQTAVYDGTAVDGYDVTVRNAGSTKLTVNVTVELRTLTGSLVAEDSAETVVLTGSNETASVRFATPVPTSTFDHVHVAAAS